MDKIVKVNIGSYDDGSRPMFEREAERSFDFLIYGQPTTRREQWRAALVAAGFTVTYSFVCPRVDLRMPQTEIAIDCLLATCGAVLDIARDDNILTHSQGRLSSALQKGAPILSDEIINLSGTIYDGCVERVTLEKLLANSGDYLSPGFIADCRLLGRAWRRLYPASGMIKEGAQLAERMSRK
jgi:hypothetical protein